VLAGIHASGGTPRTLDEEIERGAAASERRTGAKRERLFAHALTVGEEWKFAKTPARA
jgi:hypothetical protein